VLLEITAQSPGDPEWLEELRGCKGLVVRFVRGAITDRYCSRRGRCARLVFALLQTGTAIGVGMDENPALLIPPLGAWQVFGSSSVTLLEQSDGRLWVSLLRQGDTFDPLDQDFATLRMLERSSPAPRNSLEPNAFRDLLEGRAQPRVVKPSCSRIWAVTEPLYGRCGI
jgi:hypothetical protein